MDTNDYSREIWRRAKESCNASFKKLMSNKEILARFVKEGIDEFRDADMEYVVRCMKVEEDVSTEDDIVAFTVPMPDSKTTAECHLRFILYDADHFQSVEEFEECTTLQLMPLYIKTFLEDDCTSLKRLFVFYVLGHCPAEKAHKRVGYLIIPDGTSDLINSDRSAYRTESLMSIFWRLPEDYI